MTFTETNAWILTDEWKNTYIMHASGANTTDGVDAAATAAVFPAGWSVASVPLNGTFTISPRMTSAGECFYTIIRDSQDNSYHQYGCGGTTFPTDFNSACPAATQSGYVPSSTAPPPPSKKMPPPSKKRPPPKGKTCSYDGDYKIMPTLLNCDADFVAWDSPSNCKNNSIGIKSEAQLGGKDERANWNIVGLGKLPLDFTASKKCKKNKMNLSREGLILGAAKSKWEIHPVATDCNTVHIVAPTKKGAKFLGVRLSTMPGNCSGKFGVSSKPGPQTVFKLVKA